MSKDTLGDRMKLYEGQEASKILTPLLPILARIDGRSFHTFTKGMRRPFDRGMQKCMAETAKFLLEETQALVAYTQSDEISLMYYRDRIDSQNFFGGKVHKMVSTLAAMASVHFVKMIPEYFGLPWCDALPTFDCRVWTVPNLDEAANVFVWRELDATKNSIAMAARHHFPHSRLQNLDGKQMQELLFQEAGVNWNDYDNHFKRGVYFRRKKVLKKLTAEELSSLPEKHNARKNPELAVERWVTERVEMPPIRGVKNRPGALFFGEDPVV